VRDHRTKVASCELSVGCPSGSDLRLLKLQIPTENRMNVHKNARLTPRGRERIVLQVESGQTPARVAQALRSLNAPASSRHCCARRRYSSALLATTHCPVRPAVADERGLRHLVRLGQSNFNGTEGTYHPVLRSHRHHDSVALFAGRSFARAIACHASRWLRMSSRALFNSIRLSSARMIR
jgi:hypothetical protein